MAAAKTPRTIKWTRDAYGDRRAVVGDLKFAILKAIDGGRTRFALTVRRGDDYVRALEPWSWTTLGWCNRCVEVDIPGDDPETVCKGEPWVSRRLYVDGSSWLYGFALGFIARGLGIEE